MLCFLAYACVARVNQALLYNVVGFNQIIAQYNRKGIRFLHAPKRLCLPNHVSTMYHCL